MFLVWESCWLKCYCPLDPLYTKLCKRWVNTFFTVPESKTEDLVQPKRVNMRDRGKLETCLNLTVWHTACQLCPDHGGVDLNALWGREGFFWPVQTHGFGLKRVTTTPPPAGGAGVGSGWGGGGKGCLQCIPEDLLVQNVNYTHIIYTHKKLIEMMFLYKKRYFSRNFWSCKKYFA
jgi:hypothetical protein